MQKKISPDSVSLDLHQDRNGHWSVYKGKKRISGPLFNKPEIRRKVTKGYLRTIIRHNPISDNPIDFLI